MSFFVIGLNHHTAPLALRERVAFAASEIASALPDLQGALSQSVHGQARKQEEVDTQVALLSTCNRAEIYGTLDTDDEAAIERATQQALHWLAQYHSVLPKDLAEHTYVLRHNQAVEHAFAVASGMDSMVLGEPQILGQMKQAIRLAHGAGTNGTVLQQWFDKSFAVAKEVRTNTAIGEHSVSMAAAAVKLTERVFADFDSLNVLLIGAGEMMEVVAAHIIGHNPVSVTVANRSLERAHALLAPHPKVNGHVMRLTELPDQLSQFDVVVSCTAASLPIIGLGMVESALKKRRHRPIVMVDLGVPRDIEAEVGKLNDVYLYTVDDLSHIVQKNSQQREAALVDAQVIVNKHVALFEAEQQRRSFVPTVQHLRARVEQVRQAELERALGGLVGRQNMSVEEVAQVLERLSSRLVNKIMHEPTLGVQSEDEVLRAAWQTATEKWLTRS